MLFVLNMQQSQVKAIEDNKNISNLIKRACCFELELTSSIYS